MSQSAVRLAGVAVRGDQLWWSESRPEEKGRMVLRRRGVDGTAQDVIEVPWSARSRVHEYGGGAWWLGRTAAYFVHADDQQIYRVDNAFDEEIAEPQLVTAPPGKAGVARYADGNEHPNAQWLVVVQELHPHDDDEPVNTLAMVAINGSEQETVAAGADFYAAPRFSPCGNYLSWIEWDHPNMPWDGTRLVVASVNLDGDGPAVGLPTVVAGDRSTSVVDPDWLDDSSLVYAADTTGFWNLERYHPGRSETVSLTALVDAEIGYPQWIFQISRWAQVGPGTLLAIVTEQARDELASIDLSNGTVTLVDATHTRIDHLAADSGRVAVVAATVDQPQAIVELTTAKHQVHTRRHPTGASPLEPEWVSQPQPLRFKSGTGHAHAFFYAPQGQLNGEPVAGPENDRPPLIVMGHGGPTAHSWPALNLKVQFWTTRGFAVLDVNYRGSTGYGRGYQNLLRGQWGIVDVEDCIAAAEYAIAQDLVDPDRVAIRGGSAGGFTVLRALQTSKVFSAGTSLYGVADLGVLAADTHKFESRYLDSLIGPYPDDAATYTERSPINHTDDLDCPLLVMQGSEDDVVPPSQSQVIVAAVEAKGLPHVYVEFPGEQHGFRQAETIERSFQLELWFYATLFGFSAAEAGTRPPEANGFD